MILRDTHAALFNYEAVVRSMNELTSGQPAPVEGLYRLLRGMESR